MSIEAMTWALRVPIGGNAKVILLGMANHAHPDGTESYPALDTLAEYAACDRSTARRNARRLVADGWAIEDGLGPKGQTKYRLPIDIDPRNLGGGKTPPVADPGGGSSTSEGVAPAPPEPSIEPSNERKGARGRARTPVDPADDPRSKIPDGFPEELRPHARVVMRILIAVAEQHGAKKVWAKRVGLVIMARPRHPLVKAAHALASWAVDPPREIKDVVSTYETFLSKETELAATERLAADGTVAAFPASPPPGVTPIRGGSRAARRAANDAGWQALRDEANGTGGDIVEGNATDL